MTMKITLDFDDLKVGEIYDFVDLLRASGISRDEVLGREESDFEGSTAIHALHAEVSDVGSRPIVVTASNASFFAGLLTAILSADGDARTYMAELAELVRILHGGDGNSDSTKPTT